MSRALELAKQRRIVEGREPVWIVGRDLGEGKWSFQGVFSDEDSAVSACFDENYFIAPAVMNNVLPAVDQAWSGLYFPLKAVSRGVAKGFTWPDEPKVSA
jgi:hypothetical protein